MQGHGGGGRLKDKLNKVSEWRTKQAVSGRVDEVVSIGRIIKTGKPGHLPYHVLMSRHTGQLSNHFPMSILYFK